MKKLLAILIFAAIMLTMCGCSKETDDDRLFQTISVESGLYGRVIVDKTTGVMYWVSRGRGAGILTMLVNPDGSPRVYKNIGGNK